jgi:hypothetical protein
VDNPFEPQPMHEVAIAKVDHTKAAMSLGVARFEVVV